MVPKPHKIAKKLPRTCRPCPILRGGPSDSTSGCVDSLTLECCEQASRWHAALSIVSTGSGSGRGRGRGTCSGSGSGSDSDSGIGSKSDIGSRSRSCSCSVRGSRGGK